jgi:hypothetical protein
MTLEELRRIPTAKLIDYIAECEKAGNQYWVNVFAYELTTRVYVPNNGYTTFEELLEQFGYKFNEKENTK